MNDDIINLKKNQLKPSGWNPRSEKDKAQFELLKQSIARLGIRVPLIIRPKDKDGKYPIIAGDRRWNASTSDMLIPCVIQKDGLIDAKLTTLIENFVRENVRDKDHERFINNLFVDGKKSGRWTSHQTMSDLTGLPLWAIDKACEGFDDRKELKLSSETSKHVSTADLYESSSVKDIEVRKRLLELRSKAKLEKNDSIFRAEAHVVQHLSERIRDLPKKVALKYLEGEVSNVALEHARNALSKNVSEEKVLFELEVNTQQRNALDHAKKWADVDTEDRLVKGHERKGIKISTAKDKVALRKYSNALELVRKMSAIDIEAMHDQVVKSDAIESIRYMITALSTILLQIGQSVPYVSIDAKTGDIKESGDDT